jgi:hypothetical protein
MPSRPARAAIADPGIRMRSTDNIAITFFMVHPLPRKPHVSRKHNYLILIDKLVLRLLKDVMLPQRINSEAGWRQSRYGFEMIQSLQEGLSADTIDLDSTRLNALLCRQSGSAR